MASTSSSSPSPLSYTAVTNNNYLVLSSTNFESQVEDTNNNNLMPTATAVDIMLPTIFDKHLSRRVSNENRSTHVDVEDNDDDVDSTADFSCSFDTGAANCNMIMDNIIDMEKLCSEVFSQEENDNLLSGEMLEEAVKAAVDVDEVVGELMSNDTTATRDVSIMEGGAELEELYAAVTDPSDLSSDSLDGSEVTSPPPKTIEVPKVKIGIEDGAITTLAPPLIPNPKNFIKATINGVGSEGTTNSNLHFSSQANKKQRSNSSGSANSNNKVITPNYGFSGAGISGFGINNNPKVTTSANIAQVPKVMKQEDVICVKCSFPGADVRIRCGNNSTGGGGCAYHARCFDLVGLCQEISGSPPPSVYSSTKEVPKIVVNKCPCGSPSKGLEILPLSFTEMDRVQQSTRAAITAAGMKRPHSELHGVILTCIPSHAGAQQRRTIQCYDPTIPRTGRWTDQEILFRDTLIRYFLSGSLPLSNGLKLNDFLPSMLKSKQSRLAKKMKHAKLSTKYFYPKTGCVGLPQAKELSRLERDFINSIPDLVERSEVAFHMSREWREHFANRCHSLNIVFDGTQWMKSEEDMDRRLALEKERYRLAKRRYMMGKAMEKDVGDGKTKLEKGVFINSAEDKKAEFEFTVAKSVCNSSRGTGRSRVNSFAPEKEGTKGSPLQSGFVDPNFKTAAPFLAGITSYIERNDIPFEHVDVWVPSFVPDAATQGSCAPSTQDDDSASPEKSNFFRLCFGGSVTVGSQIDPPPIHMTMVGSTAKIETSPSSSSHPLTSSPLTSEDKTNYSLFGDYSEKFSFSSGCGLPGRIFKSGIPAWEQFVFNANPTLFERHGGASQFGIQTALGMPIDSPSVGRIVLVLYSKFDRKKDEALVGRMTRDLKLLCPSPRWKLVVDMDSHSGQEDFSSSLQAPPTINTAAVREEFNTSRSSPVCSAIPPTTSALLPRSTSCASSMSNPTATNDNKQSQINSLIALLASNIPTDMDSPLGKQLKGIMSLRLMLLRGNRRTPDEEQLIDTVLVLYQSYLGANRTEVDIAVMVARDFTFHLGHLKHLAKLFGCPPPAETASPQMCAHQGPLKPPPSPQMYGMATRTPMPSPLLGPTVANGYSAGQLAALHRASHFPRGPHNMIGANPMMNYNPQAHGQAMTELYLRQNAALGSPRSK